jgi:DNA processing protein
MTAHHERAALIALLRTTTRPWSAVTDDIEAAGSAIAVLEAELRPAQRQLFEEPADVEAVVEAAAADLATWARDGIQVVSILDADYPAQLLTIHQRPPFLMVRGALDPADARGVAVVGTRSATSRGLDAAATLANALVARGVPVISGLAAGIDTAALTAAVDAGGRTVAVIGTGIRRAYPAQNVDLQERIATTGLVLSQFWPDAPPTKTSFPMRNAVMSGYAAATVVIEAAWKSGARMQARLALEHGRPVFLLAPLLEHDWAREYARRPGAVVVRDADEVAERLDRLAHSLDELTWA